MTGQSSASRLTASAKRFAKNESGNIAMIFTLMAVPFIAAVGLGVDYGRSMSARGKADLAASAAALVAANSARSYLNMNGTTDAAVAAAIVQGQTAGTTAFSAQIGELATAGLSAPQVNLVRNGNIIAANVTYSGSVNAVFGQLVQVNTINYSGTATARAQVASAPVEETPEGEELFRESFENPPTNVGNGWSVFQNLAGWSVMGAGVEVGNGSLYGTNGQNPDGNNIAELDSHYGSGSNNSSISRKVTLTPGAYELSYWYYSRIQTNEYKPAWICGSRQSDVVWANAGGQTNRIGVYFDRSTGDTPPAALWDSALNRYRFDHSVNNAVDICVTSGQQWIERRIKINVVTAGDYWVTFQAEGTSETYGGLLDYIRLCYVTCSGTPRDNFPWSANALLFEDKFPNPSGSEDTLNNSGTNLGWHQLPANWVTSTKNAMNFQTVFTQPTGFSSYRGIELDANSYSGHSRNRGIHRGFLLTPGYYQLSYFYSSATYSTSQDINLTSCGPEYDTLITAGTSTHKYAHNDNNWGNNKPNDTNMLAVMIDNGTLVKFPAQDSSSYGAGINWNTPSGLSSGLPNAGQNVIDTCSKSPKAQWVERVIKFKVSKPANYWITFRAEGTGDSNGANLLAPQLRALGGLTMASPPADPEVIPHATPAVGSTVDFNQFEIIAQ